MAADYGIENFLVKLWTHNRNNTNRDLRNLKSGYTDQKAGFTLIELLVVILMIGVLSAIVAPSWQGFVNRQRLNKAYEGVLSALQQAQTSAKNSKLNYSASFRVNSTSNIAEYVIYQGTTLPSSGWNSLASDLAKSKVLLYSNMTGVNTKSSSGNIVLTTTGSGTITFDYMGALARKSDGNDADIPLKVMVAIPTAGTNQAGNLRRCAILETLIGGMRTAKDTSCT
ncbi:prepilin-type N-terminal cleavage/methylation domain-containing protein [Anabaena cylindrica FACHB-243]|uniref:PilA family protein n=1 Tax=Anabaena cylindrica (strain ATCC 27899 / PCC 7122) TaxID=272123 RepID=K9ZDI6_ANACC|nr:MULTISPECIES: prepilin-type N-terminal cleavage/methylation domain-containing protein [Anabaena]AFZ56440.1 PilA family protein [Anabaena cylindrica PCC 7122]MBD2418109.1 prepilin-type N-terminal cleavage/methylation domain-containing protein [Anabaena cylindrica FACHB-243]MBY5281955.1 prepilin-type N-terminal cleavage/methylation domain-containing protein [Anabaena sp. CCAP 1446/1C]MBY5311240.1 prepilin-type N-terminal cleavage/methylation domain-containing protein [Anabaena sp. CCAP 1446/1C